MKTVIAIIAAMIVSSAFTYIATKSSTTNKSEDRKASENNTHKEELAALRKEMVKLRADAGSQAAMVLKESNVQVPGVVTDPADLIEQLSAEGTTGADVESQKRVIHYFESLVDASDASLPAISDFMNQRLDKEFGRPSFRQTLGITGGQMDTFKEFAQSQRGQWEGFGGKMRDIWSNQEMTDEQKRDAFQKLRKSGESASAESREKFKELLTSDQRTQLEEMGEQGERQIRMMMFQNMGGNRGGGDRGGGRGGR